MLGPLSFLIGPLVGAEETKKVKVGEALAPALSTVQLMKNYQSLLSARHLIPTVMLGPRQVGSEDPWGSHYRLFQMKRKRKELKLLVNRENQESKR